MQNTLSKIFLSIIAIAAWFAVILQFYLIIESRTASVAETVVRFFSFFTILTNILVAVCCTTLLFGPNSRLGNFFSKPNVLTAITVYIMVVGIVYNIILRSLWNPGGIQKLVDELLHSFVPLSFFFSWFLLVAKRGLEWKNVFPWLLYPFTYLIYILIRGAASGFYPYPFVNVNDLGYPRVFLNSGLLFIGFLLLSLIFVGIGKVDSARKN